VQVTLQIERLYGSVDDITVQYRTASVDAGGQWDFHLVRYASVTMSSGQVIASITVQVLCSFITSAKEVMFSTVSFCLLTELFKTNIYEILRNGWT